MTTQTPDAVREALRAIVARTPRPEKDDGDPGHRCQHCQYRWKNTEGERHWEHCVYITARSALAALDSRAGDDRLLPPGWKPWTGGPFAPQDYGGRYMLRNGSYHEWRPGNGAGPNWKWEYGEGDVVAYLAAPAPAVDAVPAGEWQKIVRDMLDGVKGARDRARAALSHGEGRK